MEDLSYVKPAEPFKHNVLKTRIDEQFEKSRRIPKRFSFSVDERSNDVIPVYLRMKPDEEISKDGFLSFSEEEENALIVRKKSTISKFSFTYIFKPNATQEEVFSCSTEANLQEFFNGKNAFILTYGISSSGKTFTIQGKKNNPGLVPRIIATTFATLEDLVDDSYRYCPERSVSIVDLSENEMLEKLRIKESVIRWAKVVVPEYLSKNEEIISMEEIEMLKYRAKKLDVFDKDNTVFSIWFSFAEIYNEKIYDLLNEPKDKKTPLSLAIDRDKSSFIKGLRHIHVTTLEEAYLLYYFGCYNRSVSYTAQNDKSSRSHSIFTLKILGRKKETNDSFFVSSSFSVCDLAGTERFSKTRNYGTRMKESQNINSSFLVLNRCLKIIRENQLHEPKKVVPFRESKLTQIMGSSFTTGYTNLSMIVTVAQSKSLMDETEASLKSSAVATEIKAFVIPSVLKKKKMRFSSSFSHLDPGRGVNWNGIASSNKPIVISGLPMQNVNLPILKELEKEKIGRQEAEKKLAQVEKMHREEIEILLDEVRRLETSNKELEASQQEKEFSHLKNQIDELYDKYMNSRAQTLKIQKKVRLQKDDYDKLEIEVKKLQSSNEDLETMLDDAKEEVEELQEELKILQESVIQKDESLVLKDEKISMLELEISQLEENLAHNASEREIYDRFIRTLESDFCKKKKEIEELNYQFEEKCMKYEEEIKLLRKGLKSETSEELRKKMEISNVQIKVERSKSEECLHAFSDSDDPPFYLPNNKAKTTVKKKKRRQSKDLETCYYFDGQNNLTPINRSTGRSARRYLYKKTSEEELGEPSDSLSGDNTQASPSTIFRTLRTGKRY